MSPLSSVSSGDAHPRSNGQSINRSPSLSTPSVHAGTTGGSGVGATVGVGLGVGRTGVGDGVAGTGVGEGVAGTGVGSAVWGAEGTGVGTTGVGAAGVGAVVANTVGAAVGAAMGPSDAGGAGLGVPGSPVVDPADSLSVVASLSSKGPRQERSCASLAPSPSLSRPSAHWVPSRPAAVAVASTPPAPSLDAPDTVTDGSPDSRVPGSLSGSAADEPPAMPT